MQLARPQHSPNAADVHSQPLVGQPRPQLPHPTHTTQTRCAAHTHTTDAHHMWQTPMVGRLSFISATLLAASPMEGYASAYISSAAIHSSAVCATRCVFERQGEVRGSRVPISDCNERLQLRCDCSCMGAAAGRLHVLHALSPPAAGGCASSRGAGCQLGTSTRSCHQRCHPSASASCGSSAWLRVAVAKLLCCSGLRLLISCRAANNSWY